MHTLILRTCRFVHGSSEGRKSLLCLATKGTKTLSLVQHFVLSQTCLRCKFCWQSYLCLVSFDSSLLNLVFFSVWSGLLVFKEFKLIVQSFSSSKVGSLLEKKAPKLSSHLELSLVLVSSWTWKNQTVSSRSRLVQKISIHFFSVSVS